MGFTPNAASTHGFDDVVSEQRAFVEVDGGVDHGRRDVGVRREVHDQVVTGHRRYQRCEVGDISFEHSEARIVPMLVEVPMTARREVVEHRHALRVGVGHQPIDDMTADETGTAHDDRRVGSLVGHHGPSRDSHFVALRASAG